MLSVVIGASSSVPPASLGFIGEQGFPFFGVGRAPQLGPLRFGRVTLLAQLLLYAHPVFTHVFRVEAQDFRDLFERGFSLGPFQLFDDIIDPVRGPLEGAGRGQSRQPALDHAQGALDRQQFRMRLV